MKVIKIDDMKNLEKIDPKQYSIKFIPSIKNIEKIPLQIFYLTKLDFENFIIEFDFKYLKLPYSRVIELLIDKIYKLIQRNSVIKITFANIPKCIFEKNILNPHYKFFFEKNIFYEFDKTFNHDSCHQCRFKGECSGIDKNYIEAFSSEEFKPIFPNTHYAKIHKKRVDDFKNRFVKDAAVELLTDFSNEEEYMRRRIMYVKSFPETIEESSKERIVYFIYNRENDFEKTYHLLQKFFESDFLKKIKEYLKKSVQMCISYSVMGDGALRKTLYLESADPKEIHELSRKLNLEIEFSPHLWTIGIDFKGDKMNIKTYKKHKKINKSEILKFIEEFGEKQKSKLNEFLKLLPENISEVLLDTKYKSGKVFSKKIEFSTQFSNISIENLRGILKDDEVDYFKNKDIYSISFDMGKDFEKVNIYYSYI